MEHHTLAIPCVPMQKWGTTYDLGKSLEEGTIFPELNKSFFVAPENSNTTLPRGDDPQLLFSQVCFALDDTLLYLDTHPEDGAAREYYEKCLRKKKELMENTSCGCSWADHFQWEQKPLVWEGGHC